MSRNSAVIDEQPRIDAETAIQEARVPSEFPAAPESADGPESTKPAIRDAMRSTGQWS